jgi:6-phosphogluconolactonase (cycloisomerase 2 family)
MDPSGIDGFSINTGTISSSIPGSPFPHPSGSTDSFFSGLVTNPSGKFLYTTDGSSVIGFAIDGTTGTLSPIASGIFPTGGFNGDNVAMDPSGKFLYVVDRINGIYSVPLDPSTGAPLVGSSSLFSTPYDSQPTGIAFHPSGKYVYVTLSNAGGVEAFTVDNTTGALTLVPGSPFSTGRDPGGSFNLIAMHPSGNFLFAFNPLDPSISVFAVDPDTGALTQVTGSPFAAVSLSVQKHWGKNPKALGLCMIADPSGKFLYIGGGDRVVAAYKFDTTTRSLTEITGSPFSSTSDPAGGDSPIGFAATTKP